jgi:hypothetical protein
MLLGELLYERYVKYLLMESRPRPASIAKSGNDFYVLEQRVPAPLYAEPTMISDMILTGMNHVNPHVPVFPQE